LRASSNNAAVRVGILRMRLLIRESHSLKEKRSVIKSIKDRLKNKFNISVAEVGNLDNRQFADICVAFVSNDGRFTESTLSKVLGYARQNPYAEITSSEIEIL